MKERRKPMISIKKDTVEVTIVNNKPVIDKLSIDRKKKHKPVIKIK